MDLQVAVGPLVELGLQVAVDQLVAVGKVTNVRSTTNLAEQVFSVHVYIQL